MAVRKKKDDEEELRVEKPEIIEKEAPKTPDVPKETPKETPEPQMTKTPAPKADEAASVPAAKAEMPQTQDPNAIKLKQLDAIEKAQRQGYDRTVREHAKTVETQVVKGADLKLPEWAEKHRETLEKNNEAGLMGQGTTFGYGVNQIDVDVSSIKDEQQLAYFCTTLDTDKDKLSVISTWAKSNNLDKNDVVFHAEELLGSRLFTKPQTAQGGLNALGLVDMNGKALDLRSADFPSVVTAAQSIPNKTIRSQAFSYIEKMTKTKGSRFYGLSLEGVSKDFRDTLDFPQAAYDSFVDGINFYGSDGHEEENLRRYLAKYDAIYGENSTLNEIQKRWYRQALDDLYVSKVTGYGGVAPDPERARAVLAQLDAARAAQTDAGNQDEEENESKFGRALGALKDFVGGLFGSKGEAPDSPQENAAPVASPTPSPSASAAPSPSGTDVSTGTLVASASPTAMPAMMTGKKEESQTHPEVQGPAYQPEKSGFAPTSGSVNLENDPATALEYAYDGRADLLDAPTQDMLGRMYETDSPGQQVLLGVVTPEFYKSYQTGNTPADTQWRAAKDSVLGSSIMKYVLRISREDFPAELRGDAMMAIKEIIGAADADSTITQEDVLTLGRYETYVQRNKNALDPIENVFRQMDAMAQEAQENDAAVLAERDAELARDRQAVALGQGSEIQIQNVLNHAPQMDSVMVMRDPTYAAMVQNLETEFFDAAANWGEDSPAWLDTYTYKTMKAKGVQNLEGEESAYEMLIQGTMESLLMQDMRVASSLGMTLEDYYKKQGGMDMDLLADRASAEIVRAGGKTSEQELASVSQTVAQEAENAGLGTAKTLELSVRTGFESVKQGRLESLIMVLASTDIQRDTARIETEFNRQYGALWGRTAYRKQMTAYAKSGALPEKLSQYILSYLEEGGDPYLLGIHPGDNASVVQAYDETNQHIETYQKIIASQATKDEQALYQSATDVFSNGRMMAESAILSLVLSPVLGPAASFASLRTVYGSVSQGRSMGEFMQQGYSLRESLMLSELDVTGEALANMVTLGHLDERIKGFGALLNKGLVSLGGVKNPGVAGGFIRGVGTFFGSAASEVGEEVVKDPLLEGTISNALVGMGKSLIEDSREGRAPRVLRSIFAGVDAAVGGLPDTVANMIEEAPRTAISTLPFALLGATGDVVRESVSAKAARTYIDNPTQETAEAFMDAIEQDAQDARFVGALQGEMREAEVEEETAANLLFDPDPQLYDNAQKTREQADSHRIQMEASQTRIEEGWEAYDESGAAGDVNGQLAALETVAKGQQGLEEHTREYEQKNLEAKEAEKKLASDARLRAESVVNRRREIRNAQEREARKAQEEEKTLQREAENVATLDADDFIAQNYPDASEEEKQTLREKYMARTKDNRSAPTDQRAPTTQDRVDVGDGIQALRSSVQMAKRLETKFGTKIRFVRDLNGAEALYDADSDTVYVSMNATQGEVIGKLLVHEMTHAVEGTSRYKEMSALLLKIKYGGDNAKMRADIQSKMRRYGAYYKAAGRTDAFTEADAIKEIVADFNGEILSGNEEMINRLVSEEPSLARRMYESIRRFVQRMRGVNDQQMDQIRAVERLFEKALREKRNEKRKSESEKTQYLLGNQDLSKSEEDVQSMLRRLDSEYEQAVENGDYDAADELFAKAASEFAKPYDGSNYQNVPDTLLGFGRNGSKGFYEQKYRQPVTVLVSDGQNSFVDVVRGMNVPQAMERARRNWEGLDVRILSESEMNSIEYDSDGKVIPLSERFKSFVHSSSMKYFLPHDLGTVDASAGDEVQYNYDYLVSQEDMPVTAMPDMQTYVDGKKVNINAARADGIANAEKHAGIVTEEKRLFVENRYTKTPLQITGNALRHGLIGSFQRRRRNASAVSVAGSIAQNAIPINRLLLDSEDSAEGVTAKYLYMGMGEDAEAYYPVALVIKSKGENLGEVTRMEQLDGIEKRYLYSMNAAEHKKRTDGEDMAAESSCTSFGSCISIAEMLDIVKDEFGDGLSEDVLSRLGVERPNGQFAGRTRYSLPSDDALNAEIDAWNANRDMTLNAANMPGEPNGQNRQTPGDGERQFATQTAQRSQAMPLWLKQELLSNSDQRFYERDTNNDQLMRAWNRIQQDGYEETRDSILNSEGTLSTDDTAAANVIMAMAFRDGDVNTALEMAHRYNTEGTKQGQALQARKLFSRMTPTGIRTWAAGKAEQALAEHMSSNKRQRRKIDEQAQKAMEKIRNLRGGDELLRLAESGEIDVSSIDSRWGIPINDQQRALIDHYHLGNVARPGLYYNRATTRQRMLEAILATPNPLELTGNGLNLIQRLEYLQAGEAVITNADLEYIGMQLAQYASMDADDQQARAGDLALSRAYEAYGNITPASGREKARTWRYTSMLLSVPSAERNIIGNSAMNAVNAVSDGLAVELDKLVSHVTGQRTRAHLSLADRVSGWHGFVEETKNTFRDYFTDRTITQRNEDRFNMNQRGRVYQNQTIETMRLVEGYLMSVGDRNFWRKKFLNSMAEQQRVADQNGVTLDYNAAVEQAEAEANYATFTEDSQVHDLFAQAKRIPVFGDIVDFLMPFTGVPTNIVKRMWQYSPAGLATTALAHGINAVRGHDFNQRAFVDGMARGLTGTALFFVGMGLREAGLIHMGTGDEDDEKLRNLHAAQGDQYGPYIQIGDENISLAAFAPSISPIIMGATAQEIFRNDGASLSALANACLSGLDQIFDASYMSALQDVFKGYGSASERVFASVANNAASQNVPSVLSQIATAMDPYVRDTKDTDYIMQALKSGLIAKVPGMREALLNPKYDITGQPVESKKGIRNFIDPFTTTKVKDDPALHELERLAQTTGSSAHIPEFLIANTGKVEILAEIADDIGMDRSQGENKFVLTADERNRYNKMYSKLCFDGGDGITGIRDLMKSDEYMLSGDGDRAKLISKIRKDAKRAVQKQICKDRGWTVE